MKHHIDPKIDCVFKALLGSEPNKNLLIHFLNAILIQEFKHPIESVELLNPYNDKEFMDDKLSIVDVKAKDKFDQLYQIEIQLNSFNYLPARMIYNWADIYSKQIQSGDKYNRLRPTYSIWILAENVIDYDEDYAHNYKLRDAKGQLLNQHGGIFLLELNKFKQQKFAKNEHRWLQFFKEGQNLDDQSLPEWMQTNEMRQAMTTLSVFSDKEKQYGIYQARMEYLRVQRTIQFELEEERTAKIQALQREEVARQGEKLAKQGEIAALLEKNEAKQGEKSAILEKNEAKQGEKSAILEKNQAKQREKSALAELALLKASLKNDKLN